MSVLEDKCRKVFAVIPVYNNRKTYIKTAVNSVLSQKNIKAEVILVDDGSTEHTSSFCDSLSKNLRVTTLHKINGGYPVRGIMHLITCQR